MNLTDIFYKHEQTVEDLLDFFKDHINNNPRKLLGEINGELEHLYIREGNDQEGRGIVGEATLGATIAAMEVVRAECVTVMKKQRNN